MLTLPPSLLKPFSNREDFIQPLEFKDDDTDDPINLAYITGSGTFSQWNVRAGLAVTTSVTTITIPVYPIGDELSTLALTVGTGLSISAGDPITIADLSGNNTMAGYVLSYNSASGALTCQIGVTFQFEIRRTGPRESGSGYVPWFDFGVQQDQGPLISASLGNGVYITDLGFAQIFIPEATFRKLRPGTYLASLTLSDSASTRQVFAASLPVHYGGVTQ